MPTFASPNPITVNLELGIGDVIITASDRADTVVEVGPAHPDNPLDVKAAEATEVTFADGALRIIGKKPKWFKMKKKSEAVVIHIELPTGSRIRAWSPFGNLDLAGSYGDVRLNTAFGEIRVEQCASLDAKSGFGLVDVGHVVGRAEMTTSMGNLRAHRVDGETVMKNSNGTVQLGWADGDVKISGAAGDISVEHAGGAVQAKTSTGSIRLGRVENGEIEASTAVGRVDVGVLRGVPAHLDVETMVGRVYNELEAGAAPAPGERSVRLRLRSTTSDITIRYAEEG